MEVFFQNRWVGGRRAGYFSLINNALWFFDEFGMWFDLLDKRYKATKS